MADNVPQRGDGFDTNPSGSVGQSSGSGGFNLQALQGMPIADIMQRLSIDEKTAKMVKDVAAGGGAALGAGVFSHYFSVLAGELLHDEKAGEVAAGMIGGAVGGALGALLGNKISPGSSKSKRRKFKNG